MSEISRCPKCGGQPITMRLDEDWAIECIDCWFYSNRKFKTEKQAIDYWNKGAEDGYLLVGDE